MTSVARSAHFLATVFADKKQGFHAVMHGHGDGCDGTDSPPGRSVDGGHRVGGRRSAPGTDELQHGHLVRRLPRGVFSRGLQRVPDSATPGGLQPIEAQLKPPHEEQVVFRLRARAGPGPRREGRA